MIHGSPTVELRELKGSVADILVLDTTAHLQGSGYNDTKAQYGVFFFFPLGNGEHDGHVSASLCRQNVVTSCSSLSAELESSNQWLGAYGVHPSFIYSLYRTVYNSNNGVLGFLPSFLPLTFP